MSCDSPRSLGVSCDSLCQAIGRWVAIHLEDWEVGCDSLWPVREEGVTIHQIAGSELRFTWPVYLDSGLWFTLEYHWRASCDLFWPVGLEEWIFWIHWKTDGRSELRFISSIWLMVFLDELRFIAEYQKMIFKWFVPYLLRSIVRGADFCTNWWSGHVESE